MVEIQSLPESRWKEYRELRLDALIKEPTAFGSAFEEEKDFSIETWKNRLQNTIFAIDDGIPIGMIVVGYATHQKMNHIANLYGFYVKAEFRRHGTGTLLMNYTIRQIRTHQNILKVRLNVNSLQKTAIKLYEKFGFEIVGQLKSELQVDGQLYNEIILEKFFKKEL